MKITYELAKHKPEFRQLYLDSLIPQFPASLSRAIYDPEKKHICWYIDKLADLGHISLDCVKDEKEHFIKSNFIFFSIYSYKAQYGCAKPSQVYCFNPSFSETDTESEFFSILIDHEGQHADNTMQGIKLTDRLIDGNSAELYPQSALLYLEEFLAFRNQTLMLGKREVTKVFSKKIVNGLRKYTYLAGEFYNIDDLMLDLSKYE